MITIQTSSQSASILQDYGCYSFEAASETTNPSTTDGETNNETNSKTNGESGGQFTGQLGHASELLVAAAAIPFLVW
jgi:hypothetical protein